MGAPSSHASSRPACYSAVPGSALWQLKRLVCRLCIRYICEYGELATKSATHPRRSVQIATPPPSVLASSLRGGWVGGAPMTVNTGGTVIRLEPTR